MWTCPSCQSTVDEVFEACWNCGTSRDGVADPTFVRADDQGAIADPDVDALGVKVTGEHSATLVGAIGGDLVAAYRARDLIQAHFLVDRLTEAGFPATADEQDLNKSLGGMTSGPRVYVRQADLAAARAWLADYDRNHNITTD